MDYRPKCMSQHSKTSRRKLAMTLRGNQRSSIHQTAIWCHSVLGTDLQKGIRHDPCLWGAPHPVSQWFQASGIKRRLGCWCSLPFLSTFFNPSDPLPPTTSSLPATCLCWPSGCPGFCTTVFWPDLPSPCPPNMSALLFHVFRPCCQLPSHWISLW